VSGEQDSRTDIFEDESARLKDALKSCRNVVANYRAMLSATRLRPTARKKANRRPNEVPGRSNG